MPEAFTVLWTQDDRIRLKKAKDHGPLSVIFASGHTSLPCIHHVNTGDVIYPILITKGVLHVVAGMEVRYKIPAEDYFRLVSPQTDFFSVGWSDDLGHLGHRVPRTSCVGEAAVGAMGTDICFDRPLAPEALSVLRLGPDTGREKPIKGLVDGKLQNHLSFHGHVRRLSHESAPFFADMLKGKWVPLEPLSHD